MKKCTSCFLEKPIIEFNYSVKAKDGRQNACRECNKAYHKAYTEARKTAKQKVVLQSKVCRDCGLEKPIGAFGKRAQSLDKHNIYCKTCWRIRCNGKRRNDSKKTQNI